MNQNDLNDTIAMCKRRIDRKKDYDSLINEYSVDDIMKIENILKGYIEMKNKHYELNKPYWMLLCNPNQWFGKNTSENKNVNYILSVLGDKSKEYETELWKLNSNPSMAMDKKIRDGDLGIIKVGFDGRSKKIITKEDILQSGIYGIFKLIATDFDIKYPQTYVDPINDEVFTQTSSMLWENEFGTIFGKVQVIDNYFSKNKIITKIEAIKIMGETLYTSPGSRNISKDIFEKITNYHES